MITVKTELKELKRFDEFKELRDKALSPSATYDDMFDLDAWLSLYGKDRWNGESWSLDDDANADDSLRLYPKLGAYVILRG